MDRHDLRGLKTDDVAEAHRRDVDIQDRHGVKYMAYWFDENNGAAFCLVHAPDPETAERVHREAHGEIPNAIIPVDLATVEAFLGRISDPRAAPSAAPPVQRSCKVLRKLRDGYVIHGFRTRNRPISISLPV